MTTITIEDIKAAHAKVAELIASFEAQPKPTASIVQIPGASIELQPGEHYAGLILSDDGTPDYHLVLLAPAPEERMAWEAAVAWASQQGGALPNRREQSLLFANSKAQFDSAWYWSCEQHEDDGACAWNQNFFNGAQDYGRTSYEARVRAVRRIPA